MKNFKEEFQDYKNGIIRNGEYVSVQEIADWIVESAPTDEQCESHACCKVDIERIQEWKLNLLK